MSQESTMHLLDGTSIDYTYDGGWRFIVKFYHGLVAYQFMGDSQEQVSNSNQDIPYQSRLIRDNLYHVIWHETNIGDLVSLIIDIENHRIFSAALLGYRGSDYAVHFEGGDITQFSQFQEK